MNGEDKNKEKESLPYEKLPYPNLKKKYEKEWHFKKFMGMLVKLHINIFFAEVLKKIQVYAKFIGKKNKSTWWWKCGVE